MVPSIAGTTSIQAYRHEASRLASAEPRLSGKAVTRDTAVSIGPFSVHYTTTDYEFEPLGTDLPAASFADALDAARQTRSLAEAPPAFSGRPNALTRRQALAGYRTVRQLPDSPPASMLSLTV